MAKKAATDKLEQGPMPADYPAAARSRLVGAGIPDFYGAYFEQRLGSVRRLLR